jgi:ketosteroid isomerase-like protein
VHPRVILLAGIAAILTAACSPRPFDAGPAPRLELQAREASFLAALAAKDVERTVGHFAEDAVLHVANMPPVRGRSAIRQFYGNVFRFLDSSAPVSEMIRASSVGDMGYSMGRVTNTFTGQDGPVEYAGKYLLVWERRGEEWLIATYSISNDQAEARR